MPASLRRNRERKKGERREGEREREGREREERTRCYEEVRPTHHMYSLLSRAERSSGLSCEMNRIRNEVEVEVEKEEEGEKRGRRGRMESLTGP